MINATDPVDPSDAELVAAGWQPIATAPRNGLTVWVMDVDVGAWPMGWMADRPNHLAGGAPGVWETPGQDVTWSEHDGGGPSWWKPLDQDGEGS